MADLVVHFSIDGERSVLQLAGELDLETAPELRMHGEAELAAARCRTLTIDMSGVTFMDSTGLGVLVDLRRMASVAEIALELTDLPPRVARVIAIAGLADTFGVSSDDAPAG